MNLTLIQHAAASLEPGGARRYTHAMSAAQVIKELEELPSQEREKVLRWLQQQGLPMLWQTAGELMKGAPKLTEDEILNLPRVRPSGF